MPEQQDPKDPLGILKDKKQVDPLGILKKKDGGIEYLTTSPTQSSSSPQSLSQEGSNRFTYLKHVKPKPPLDLQEIASAPPVNPETVVGTPEFEEKNVGEGKKYQSMEEAYNESKAGDATLGKAIFSGAASVPASMLKSIGIAAKRMDLFNEYGEKKAEDLATYKAGKWVEDKVKDLVGELTPEEQDRFAVKIATGAGQMGGFVLGGWGGKILKMSPLLTTATLGASVQGASEYEAAIQAGATPDQAAKVFWINGLIGTTEALPIASAFRKIDKYTGGLATGALAKKISSTVGGRLTNDAVQGFITEASQEAVSQLMTNVVASETYDAARSIWDGVLEAGAIGGVLGGAMTGIASGIRERRAMGGLTKAEDNQLAITQKFAEEKADEALDANKTEATSPTYENSKVKSILKSKTDIESDLASNENLPEETRATMQSEIAALDEQLEVAKSEAYQQELDKGEASIIKDDIRKNEELLADTSLSEGTKSVIQKSIDADKEKLSEKGITVEEPTQFPDAIEIKPEPTSEVSKPIGVGEVPRLTQSEIDAVEKEIKGRNSISSSSVGDEGNKQSITTRIGGRELSYTKEEINNINEIEKRLPTKFEGGIDVNWKQRYEEELAVYKSVLQRHLNELKAEADKPIGVDNVGEVPLSEKEFEKKYKAQHKDMRGVEKNTLKENRESILRDGFKRGIGVNAVPIFKKDDWAATSQWGNKKGDIIYIATKDGFKNTEVGYKINDGHKFKPEEVIEIEYDGQPTYEAYVNNLKKLNERTSPTPETNKPIQSNELVPEGQGSKEAVQESVVNVEQGNAEAAATVLDVLPPSKPPIEASAADESPKSGKRRFTEQMLRDEELPQESMGGIRETLDYAIQKNKISTEEAASIIKKVGTDEAYRLVTDMGSDLKPAVRTVMGMALIRKYGELAKWSPDEVTRDYYLDKEIAAAKYVTEKLATESGQMIQAFSLFGQLSSEAQIRDAQKDVAKQAKEKMRRREKDVNKISDEFKKANEQTVEEIVKSDDIKETVKKDENEKISKAKEKIVKAKQKRADIIKKYKSDKGKNLFSSPTGLTPEGIEFVGNVAKTYLDEGVANLEILVQKVIIHLEEVSGKKVTDEIGKQVTEISDKKFNKEDISLIGRTLKDSGLKINEIIKKHYTDVEASKKKLAQKFMDEAGMEQSNAKELAKKVGEAFDRIATRKKRNILYHEKARFDRIQKAFQGGKKAEPKTVQSDIIKYSNLGAFDNAEMMNMLADKFGLKDISPEQAKKLNELSEKVQNAPEGSPKNDATEDLLAYRAKIRGNDLGETIQAVWYANILSGYRTHEKNLVSTFFNSMGELGAEMAKDPKAIPYLMMGYFNGIKNRGMVESVHTLKTGRSPIHIKKIETPGALERKDFIGGNFNPANWFKYVTRLMVAEDVLSFQGLKEARAYQLARKEASQQGYNTWTKKGLEKVNDLLFNTTERFEIARDQALTEGAKEGSYEYARRVYELMENSRPEKMTEDAYSFAANGTFNYESTGTLGAFTNAISRALDTNVGGVSPGRFVVPFTRIITNVVNNSLDFSPVGLIRAARGKRGFKSFEEIPTTKGAYKELTREERQRLVAKAAIGIALAATFQALHEEEVIEVFGAGPSDTKKKQQLKQQGWEEYSIKVGNKYYSYKLTPLVFTLGYLGNMNDQAKYGDDDENTLMKKMQMATMRVGGQIAAMTWINSAGTFLGALANERPDEQERAISNALSGTARGFIPGSQAIIQSTQLYENIFRLPAKQVNNSWQALIQDIPIARNSLNDKINALGEPVKKDIDVIVSKENTDPVWKFMDEKKIWVAPVSKNSIFVFDTKTKMDRPITDDEYYEFSKKRGGFIKRAIEEVKNGIHPVERNGVIELINGNQLKSKELNKIVSELESKATEKAKTELFGEKEKSEFEKKLDSQLKKDQKKYEVKLW